MPGYSTVFFDPAAWDRAVSEFPKRISSAVLDAVTNKGQFEFQFDSVVYSVPLGKRVVFPTEIANHARKRGLIFENHLNAEPVELIRVEASAPLGQVDPHQCPVPGCGATFEDYSKMGLHLAEAHGTPAAGANRGLKDKGMSTRFKSKAEYEAQEANKPINILRKLVTEPQEASDASTADSDADSGAV